jgi:Polysaccharide lyase
MRMLVFVAFLFVAQASQPTTAADSLREGFEGSQTHFAFVPCQRPENDIFITADRARTGSRSLMLSIQPIPLFERQGAAFTEGLNPERCLLYEQEDLYWNDDAERAELWENKNRSPKFGDEFFYGFSMWVDDGGAPYGDFNRVVVSQWKATEDDSPFLAQRLTGGFYHISLDVDATAGSTGRSAPDTCKVLLAFTAKQPSPSEEALELDRPPQCELRLQNPDHSVRVENELEVKRLAYLPEPFDRWTDLVFRVKGGENGIVQLWADGALIATATGFIGHAAGTNQKQYFKIGPYRDPAGYGITLYIDNLSRGRSFEEVDPSTMD